MDRWSSITLADLCEFLSVDHCFTGPVVDNFIGDVVLVAHAAVPLMGKLSNKALAMLTVLDR